MRSVTIDEASLFASQLEHYLICAECSDDFYSIGFYDFQAQVLSTTANAITEKFGSIEAFCGAFVDTNIPARCELVNFATSTFCHIYRQNRGGLLKRIDKYGSFLGVTKSFIKQHVPPTAIIADVHEKIVLATGEVVRRCGLFVRKKGKWDHIYNDCTLFTPAFASLHDAMNQHLWRLTFRLGNSAGISLPVNHNRVKALLATRDMPTGSSRRKPVRHVVESYYRETSREDEMAYIKRHPRGQSRLPWFGFTVDIVPPRKYGFV